MCRFSVDRILEFCPFRWHIRVVETKPCPIMFHPVSLSATKAANHSRNLAQLSVPWVFSSWTTCTFYGRNFILRNALWVEPNESPVSCDKRLKLDFLSWLFVTSIKVGSISFLSLLKRISSFIVPVSLNFFIIAETQLRCGTLSLHIVV